MVIKKNGNAQYNLHVHTIGIHNHIHTHAEPYTHNLVAGRHAHI